MTALRPLLGLHGNLSSTQRSNRAGQRSGNGEKGSSAYNGCKAAKLGRPGFLHCLWPGAGGSASVSAAPSLPTVHGASDLERRKVLRVRPPAPGQVPKRKVEWGAGGLGSMGVASAPRWARARGWDGGALSCGPGDGRAVLLGLHAEGRDA